MRQDPEASELLTGSRVPETSVAIPACTDASLDALFEDAYGVQHHGEDSPQAIQSVAVHLLNVHGIIAGKTTRPGWALARAVRQKGVFHKLTPPALGSALTIRHLFPGWGSRHSGLAHPIRSFGVRGMDVAASCHCGTVVPALRRSRLIEPELLKDS